MTDRYFSNSLHQILFQILQMVVLQISFETCPSELITKNAGVPVNSNDLASLLLVNNCFGMFFHSYIQSIDPYLH